MDFADLVGYVAALCSACTFLPQLVRTWRTKSTEGLSAGLFVLAFVAAAFWLAYGLLIGDGPIILCNVIALGFVGANGVLLLRHRPRPAVPERADV